MIHKTKYNVSATSQELSIQLGRTVFDTTIENGSDYSSFEICVSTFQNAEYMNGFELTPSPGINSESKIDSGGNTKVLSRKDNTYDYII